jgi:hypothetical protein
MFLACLQAVLALSWSAPRLRGRGKQRCQWGKAMGLDRLCRVKAEGRDKARTSTG